MASAVPWTAEEIRQNARSWSLEGDAKLLEFMQSISQNLENRATETTGNMNRLGLIVDRTNVDLGNITNQLAALQHSQFVENRVYEDDETLANVTEVPVEDQNKKTDYDPMETLKTVLKNSMTMMERCYEKVTIEIDDSDDEGEPSTSVIYRPKNPYENRPFPYIIGSKEWIEKRHIGICDSDDEYSGDENQDEFSESSENASVSASLPSNAPTISESEFSVWGLHGNPDAGDNKRSSDDDALIDDSKLARGGSDDASSTLPQQHILPSSDPALGRYYVHKPKQKVRGLFDDSTDESSDNEVYNLKPDRKKSAQGVAVGQKISNIFSDEPPDLDVVDKEEREPHVDLFYDSDDNAPTAPIPKKDDSLSSNIRKKTVNLFDDDDFDSFMKELNDKTNQTLNKVNEAQKKARNLFDESSEEDESVVAAHEPMKTITKSSSTSIAATIGKEIKAVERTPSTVSAVKPKPRGNLFVDDLFAKPAAVPADKIIKANVSTNLFNDETAEVVNNIPAKPTATEKTRITNLFDDEPPDDDFDTLFNATNVSAVGKIQTDMASRSSVGGLNSSRSIFNDLEDHGHGTNSKVSSRSIFNDLEDRADVESSKVRDFSPSNIFDDAEELPRPIPKARTNLSKPNASKLFPDDSDDSNLFDENDRKKGEVLSKQKAVIRDDVEPPPQDHDTSNAEARDTNKPPGLFHDVDNNNDSLFSHTFLNQSEKKDVSSISNIFSNKLLDNENSDDLFAESKTVQVTGGLNVEGKRESTQGVMEDKNESYHSELPSALDADDYSEASSLAAERDLFEKVPKIQDPPSEKSTLTKTDLTSILNESNNEKKFAVASNEQSLKCDIFASTLFSDTPPDDDVLFDNLANESDIIDDNVLFSNTNSSTVAAASFSSALNYSLFHDLPPDDDFQTSSIHDTKKLHSIFYNDFSETIVPTQSSTSKTISSFISNEPPPSESFDQNDHSTTRENQLERIGSQSKITALIDKVEKDIAGPSEKSIKSKPQPKKLNTNLSINVAALLPGAKRPSVKAETIESRPLSLNAAAGDAPDEGARTPLLSDPNKLQSLTKTRPKIEVKRRPSTRRARQENYRRTLVLDEEIEVPTDPKSSDLLNENTASDRAFKDEGRQTESSSERICDLGYGDPVVKTGETVPKGEKISSKEKKEKKEKKAASELVLPGGEYVKSDQQPELITEKGDSLKSTEALTQDDFFSRLREQPQTIAKSSKGDFPNARVSPKLFDDDFFIKEVKQTNKVGYRSFLENDENDENDDKEFEQLQSKSDISTKFFLVSDKKGSKISQQVNEPPKASNIFLDDVDNDNDNDLFASAMGNTVGAQKLSASLAESRNITPVEVSKVRPPEISKSQLSKDKPTSSSTKKFIFEDHDDDDDDLFNRNLKTASNIIQTQSKAIFGSDEDDGDDIFRTVKTKPAMKISESVGATTKPIRESGSTSLFDDMDDDDDDDLFGGYNSNTKSRNVVPSSSTVKKEEIKNTSTMPLEKDFNDPLADLWNR